MERRNAVIETKHLYCTHLSDADVSEIKNFSVVNKEGIGVEKFIRFNSYIHEDTNLDRSYLIRVKATDELVAYFSLRAGFVALDNTSGNEDSFDSIPGVEISNFAINKHYRQKHPKTKGIGKVIFENIIKPIIGETAKLIGVRIIYIFALPKDKLLSYYHGAFDFARLSEEQENKMHNRIRPAYDKDCIFMYQRI